MADGVYSTAAGSHTASSTSGGNNVTLTDSKGDEVQFIWNTADERYEETGGGLEPEHLVVSALPDGQGGTKYQIARFETDGTLIHTATYQ